MSHNLLVISQLANINFKKYTILDIYKKAISHLTHN